jgi:hypothetical protein
MPTSNEISNISTTQPLCSQARIHRLAVNSMYNAAQRARQQQIKITHASLTSIMFDQHASVDGCHGALIMTWVSSQAKCFASQLLQHTVLPNAASFCKQLN